MSTNYLVNVPKLKGRENYDDWCFAAENVLVLEGMADNIKRPLPATAKEAQIAEDLKAKAKLILTIDASLYVHIKQATTTYSLWQILKNMFDDSGYARKISLLRNLISIRLENCESMTSYVSQIIETAHKLNGTGFEINDQWIGSLMLAGLPEKFSPMIMAIEHSGINISADAIKTKLLDMSADFEGKSEGAFAAKKFHRRNVGSTARTQVQQHGNSATNGMYGSSSVTVNASGQAQTSRKKIIRCYKCKQTGHFKNQCQVADKAKSNAFSAVFLTKEFSQSDWHLDSGASTHIVSNVNLLTNVCNRPKTKEIIVANQTVVPVSCSGDLQLTTCVGDNEFTIDVKDVLCVPNLTTNLLSVSRIIASEAEDIISQESVESLPEKRVRRKPDFYQSANMCVEMLDEHISLSDAMNGSEKDQWQSAMQQELESFRDNDSWELVDRPSEGTIVKNNGIPFYVLLICDVNDFYHRCGDDMRDSELNVVSRAQIT
ncbi:Retrovirus-related Pol polyprotein from transposon TNT 1-94 [Eumeta japonica]|uniref:Retrovirus-related Pol polyprotein from transposon TNT 1-94 n=1 Tax=Eumeta variegata TaxID=151549 RepID=A0A4C1YTD8_EUMVA|nr:Retrovirus-related Pol polyprotein from transposon TNT 1-94 [Eumeta japonica]